MTVELANEADIQALTELRLKYLEEDLGPLGEDGAAAIKSALPDYFKAHLGKDLFAFLAREGGSIASCALLLITEKPMSPSFPNGRTGTVLNVYTRPAFRRRGCASLVMRALLKKADELDLCLTELKSTDDGHGLYLSLGFSDDNSKYRPMRRTRS